jgi:hypothetical protein
VSFLNRTRLTSIFNLLIWVGPPGWWWGWVGGHLPRGPRPLGMNSHRRNRSGRWQRWLQATEMRQRAGYRTTGRGAISPRACVTVLAERRILWEVMWYVHTNASRRVSLILIASRVSVKRQTRWRMGQPRRRVERHQAVQTRRVRRRHLAGRTSRISGSVWRRHYVRKVSGMLSSKCQHAHTLYLARPPHNVPRFVPLTTERMSLTQ